MAKQKQHQPLNTLHLVGLDMLLLHYLILFKYFWHRYALQLLIALLAIVVLSGGALFLQGRSVQLSLASSSTCTNKFVLLPNMHQTSGQSLAGSFQKQTKIGNFPLFSRQICVTPTAAPVENATQRLKLSYFGIVGQTITVKNGTFAKLEANAVTGEPIAAHEPLNIPLSHADKVFAYAVSVNSKTADCSATDATLTCPVQTLALDQGATYDLEITRLFNGKPAGTALATTITTINSLEVTASSIAQGSTVIDKPTQVVIDLNKPVRTIGTITMKQQGSETVFKPKVAASTTQLTITFDQALARNAKFDITLEGFVAEDKGVFRQSYVLSFSTSAGPKIVSSNIPSYGMDVAQNLVVTFDQEVAAANIADHISLTVPFTASVQDKTVTINPTQNLPRCTAVTLKIDDSVANTHGVAGGSVKTYNSRTRCASVSTIGTSVRGRAITAYSFGTGASKIVYVGGMHGNEKSSKYLMDAWINELEANPGRIPANRTIIVIPNANPDGFAASSRTNYNGVDLNRNFPASDWQSGTYMPGGVYAPNGGGSAPLSESESRALAQYVQGQNPRLVLTYHATAAVVIANDSGDSSSLAAKYASLARYSNVNDAASDEVFEYHTTGEFEDWLHDKESTAALLIELATMSSNEFTRNKDALWAMATLP